METATFYFTGRDNLDLPNDVRPRGRMQYLSGLQEGKARLVQGRWPGIAGDGGYDDGTGETDNVVIEVAVDPTGFEFLDIPLGEGFGVVPATGGEGQPTTQVVVVGIIEPVDRDEEYWYRRDKLLSYHDDDWTLVPLFVSEDALRQQVGRRYPGIYTSSAWFLQVDRTGLPAKQVDEFQLALRQVRREVANHLPNGSTSTGLARILEDHEERLLLARIPLFLMVFLVTGILAYYLTITAGMVIRAQGRRDRHAQEPGSNHAPDWHTHVGGRAAAGRAGSDRGSPNGTPAGKGDWVGWYSTRLRLVKRRAPRRCRYRGRPLAWERPAPRWRCWCSRWLHWPQRAKVSLSFVRPAPGLPKRPLSIDIT